MSSAWDSESIHESDNKKERDDRGGGAAEELNHRRSRPFNSLDTGANAFVTD